MQGRKLRFTEMNLFQILHRRRLVIRFALVPCWQRNFDKAGVVSRHARKCCYAARGRILAHVVNAGLDIDLMLLVDDAIEAESLAFLLSIVSVHIGL